MKAIITALVFFSVATICNAETISSTGTITSYIDGQDQQFSAVLTYEPPTAVMEQVNASFDVLLDTNGGFGFHEWFRADNPTTVVYSCGTDCELLYSFQADNGQAAYHYFWGNGFTTSTPTIGGGWMTLFTGSDNLWAHIDAADIAFTSASASTSSVPEPTNLAIQAIMTLMAWTLRRGISG